MVGLFRNVQLAVLWSAATTLVGFSLVSADSHPSPCHGGLDSAECLAATKELMASEDRFWFGSSYQFACGFPPASFTPPCINSDKEHLSIITRVRESDDSNVDVIQQVLNVTFDVPAGSYEACGDRYSVPAVTLTVDPTLTTPISLWSADHLPHVSWRSEVNKTYALIVWDAGSRFLHCFKYNIKGSNLDTAQTGWNYNGPKNFLDRNQPYVFLLYEQDDEFNSSYVTNVIIAALSASTNLAPTKIVNSLSLTGPVGVSVLTVVTDPYSAWFMKKSRITNKCPGMLTPVFSALPLSYNVTGVSLKSSVDVSFTTEDIDVTYCCLKVSFAANTRIPNPMGNGQIPPVYTRHTPSVSLVPVSFFDTYYYLRNLYTLLLLDVTDDLAGASNPDTRLHWQVVNIRQGDVTSGQTTQPYKAPLPLTGESSRTLMFLLLQQSAVVNATGLTRFAGDSCPTTFSQRCQFNLTAFITEHGMHVEGASWFVSSPDAYSRRRVVFDNLQKTPVACQGVAGFSSPCPTSCQTSGSGVTVDTSLRFAPLVVGLGLLLRAFLCRVT